MGKHADLLQKHRDLYSHQEFISQSPLDRHIEIHHIKSYPATLICIELRLFALLHCLETCLFQCEKVSYQWERLFKSLLLSSWPNIACHIRPVRTQRWSESSQPSVVEQPTEISSIPQSNSHTATVKTQSKL